MWGALLDKFQCCLKPENNSERINQPNKEVCLDKLEERVK